MTQEQIEDEDEKIMAEFMGFHFLEDGSVNVKYQRCAEYLSNWDMLHFKDDLKWLYPVMYEVQNICRTKGIKPPLNNIHPNHFGIKECFRLHIEFIKEHKIQFYNQTQKP